MNYILTTPHLKVLELTAQLMAVSTCDEQKALGFIDEFGGNKTDAALELMASGISMDDVAKMLRLDVENNLLNPYVRRIVVAAHNRAEESELKRVAQKLAKAFKH